MINAPAAVLLARSAGDLRLKRPSRSIIPNKASIATAKTMAASATDNVETGVVVVVGYLEGLSYDGTAQHDDVPLFSGLYPLRLEARELFAGVGRP